LVANDSAASLTEPANLAEPERSESAAPQGKSIFSRILAAWRIPCLLALTLAASVFGLFWKHDGNPPSDSLVRRQVIQIFVSDPNATVQLTAAYADFGKNSMLEDIYLSIIPPQPSEDVEWALVSVDHRIDCNVPTLGLPSKLVFGLDPRAPAQPAWLCEGDTTGTSVSSLATIKGEVLPSVGRLQNADPLAAETTNGSFVASTPFPAVDVVSSGVLFARVPALDLEQLPQPGVALIVGFDHQRDKLQYLLNEDPTPLSAANSGSASLAAYKELPGTVAEIPTPFFAPANIRTQALLELTGTQSRLVNYRIDQVDPSDGSFDNGNFTWSGTGYIEPTVSMSDPNVDQARSSDELLAGIALGIAASAFIAFLQELPRSIRRGHKRRAAQADAQPAPGGA
jgi:hypothetical protein